MFIWDPARLWGKDDSNEGNRRRLWLQIHFGLTPREYRGKNEGWVSDLGSETRQRIVIQRGQTRHERSRVSAIKEQQGKMFVTGQMGPRKEREEGRAEPEYGQRL